jgi:ribosomal protein S14
MPKYTPIPHNVKDNGQCPRCSARPAYYQQGIWYTLCKSCLKETELGPFKKRLPQVGQEYEDW